MGFLVGWPPYAISCLFMFFPDKVDYIRTCTKSLRLHITIAMVCMKESRPGDGKLCFCSHDFCNSATSLKQSSLLTKTNLATLSLAAMFLLNRFLFDNWFLSLGWTQFADSLSCIMSHSLLCWPIGLTSTRALPWRRKTRWQEVTSC